MRGDTIDQLRKAEAERDRLAERLNACRDLRRRYKDQRDRLGRHVEGLQAALVACSQACWKEGQTVEGLSKAIRRAVQEFLDGKNPAQLLIAERDRLAEALRACQRYFADDTQHQEPYEQNARLRAAKTAAIAALAGVPATAAAACTCKPSMLPPNANCPIHGEESMLEVEARAIDESPSFGIVQNNAPTPAPDGQLLKAAANEIAEVADYLKTRLDAYEPVLESAWLDPLMSIHGDLLAAAEQGGPSPVDERVAGLLRGIEVISAVPHAYLCPGQQDCNCHVVVAKALLAEHRPADKPGAE